MVIPYRGHTGLSTYFITASIYQKKNLFQSDQMARMFVDVLFHYREQKKYLLHEFVVMPDHFHALLTPSFTLEKAVQFIKGGFSYRANKHLGFGGEVWETSFYDRRVRDLEEYGRFRQYIQQNRVKRNLAGVAQHYAYSSANPKFGMELDAVPQRLKPLVRLAT